MTIADKFIGVVITTHYLKNIILKHTKDLARVLSVHFRPKLI
jgi:hypothetical protein